MSENEDTRPASGIEQAPEPTLEHPESREDADQAASDGDASAAQVFKPLTGASDGDRARDLDMITEIPVTLTVELGKTRLTIRELLDLAKGSLVELDGLAGEPMDILINGYLIAQGEVVTVDDKYGLRITDIVNRAERIHKLNQ